MVTMISASPGRRSGTTVPLPRPAVRGTATTRMTQAAAGRHSPSRKTLAATAAPRAPSNPRTPRRATSGTAATKAAISTSRSAAAGTGWGRAIDALGCLR